MAVVSPNEETTANDSKTALLVAGRREFARKGLEGTTVKDIADSAGVNISLVSYYFGGKEGLYRACLSSVMQDRLDLTARVLRPAASAEEFRVRLKLFAEEFLALHYRDPDLLMLFHRDFDGRQPIALEVFKEVAIAIFGRVSEFIESGKAVGIVRRDVDVDCCVPMLFGTLVHAIHIDFLRCEVHGVSLADPGFQERFIQQYVRNFTDGILERAKP